jgi:hypothetical protein
MKMMAMDLSLASNPTEARKFSRDAEVRSGTPRPEVVRLKTLTLSRSWGRISVVVIHRNADDAQGHHGATGIEWHYDEEDHCSRAQGCRPVGKPELTLARQSSNEPDPRLVEFVRLLARRAAREWHEQIVREHRPERS